MIGPLRIQTPVPPPLSPPPAPPIGATPPAPSPPPPARPAADAASGFDQYVSRLVRLIPGEILGLYMLGAGFIPKADDPARTGWVGVCLLLLFVSRIRATRGADGRPQWPAVLIAAAAFLVWLCWMREPPFRWLEDHLTYLPQLLVLVFVFVVPWVYAGDPVAAAPPAPPAPPVVLPPLPPPPPPAGPG